MERIREGLPIRVTRDELAALKQSPEYLETPTGRWIITMIDGERRLCPLRVDGERHYENTAAPPSVTVDDATGDIATPFPDAYVEPTAKSIATVERLLDAREVEALLDGLGLLNWRKWPSAPPSLFVAGKLMYTEADARAWAERWRNAFCDPDDLSFDWDGNVLTPL